MLCADPPVMLKLDPVLVQEGPLLLLPLGPGNLSFGHNWAPGTGGREDAKEKKVDDA